MATTFPAVSATSIVWVFGSGSPSVGDVVSQGELRDRLVRKVSIHVEFEQVLSPYLAQRCG